MIYKIVVENVKTHEVIRKYKTKISTMQELISIVEYHRKDYVHVALYFGSASIKENEIYVLVSVRE